MVSTEFAVSGPSGALRSAYNSSVFASSTRKVAQDALKKKARHRGGGHPSLDSFNVHCLKVEECLTKNGKEVGTIQFTIDAWWLGSNDAQAKAELKQKL